jgi:dUTP pyrophosphatase
MLQLPTIQGKILDHRLGSEFPLPSWEKLGSAGMDLRAMINVTLDLQPGEAADISTGLALYIEDQRFAAIALPRSGLGSSGLTLRNTLGLIDSDYQGEIGLRIRNTWNKVITINPGDRIAQLVIVPVFHPVIQWVDEFSETSARGAGGFGHSGTQ